MNREDYRALSDEGLALAVNNEMLVGVLRRAVAEHELTINTLTADLDATRRAALLEVYELRRQVAESEDMRAKMSQELQRVRSELREAIRFAAHAVTNDLATLEELSEMGMLNITGHAMLDESKAWLEKYGTE